MKVYYSDGTISSEIIMEKTLHRKDGPAINYGDGERHWYFNGERHREDGPAVEFLSTDVENPRMHGAWFLDGVEYSEREYWSIMKEINEMPLELRLTDPREWVRQNVILADKQRD